jgi:hypothetical protein
VNPLNNSNGSTNYKIFENLSNSIQNFRVSHTYHAYLKLINDKRNPLYGLRGKDLQLKLKEIVTKGWELGKVLDQYDYGIGSLRTVLFTIPIEKYQFIFAIDVIELVLLNFFPINEPMEQSFEKLLIPCLSFEDEIDCGRLKVLPYMDWNYFVINNHYAFEEYKKLNKSEENTGGKKVYRSLWDDFNTFVNNGESKGTFSIMQVKNVLILTDYKLGLSEHHNSLTKILPPTGWR